MGELINGRTPEEIKRGILCSNGCCDCPYAGCISEDETCSEYVERDTLALIEHLESERDAALEKVPKWISVEERLPEERMNPITQDFEWVLCLCGFGGVPRRIDIRTYEFGNGHFYHGFQVMDGVVTHWMPRPEPPEEETT